MNRHSLRALAIVALVLPLASNLTSCGTVERTVYGPVEALVVVDSAGGGQEEYLVPASANGSCKAAVREMRNKEWEKAITGFKQALVDDSDDEHAHFGLGMAYEVTGKLDEALKEYQLANRIPRTPSPIYDTAIKRVQAKLGK